MEFNSDVHPTPLLLSPLSSAPSSSLLCLLPSPYFSVRSPLLTPNCALTSSHTFFPFDFFLSSLAPSSSFYSPLLALSPLLPYSPFLPSPSPASLLSACNLCPSPLLTLYSQSYRLGLVLFLFFFSGKAVIY